MVSHYFVISLMTYDMLFTCLLTICVSFDEISVKVFGPFLNWVVFLLLSFRSSLYVLDNSALSYLSFANIFSQCVACVLPLLTFFFSF